MKWTKEEEDILHTFYPVEFASEVSKRLPNRTSMAISIRAKKLKISKKPTKFDRPTPSRELMFYTAGILDGEGSIQINPSKNRKGGKSYWNLTVQISTVSDGFLEELCKEWGVGKVTIWRSRGSKAGRTVKNWRIYSAQAGWFLKIIYPFLRIKKKQAEIAIEFLQFRAAPGEKLSENLIAKRTQFAEAISNENAKTGKGLGQKLNTDTH